VATDPIPELEGVPVGGITRRQFLVGTGALVVGFSLAGALFSSLAEAADTTSGATLPADLAKTPSVDAWLKVDAAGHVTVLSGKVDLGQGIGIAFEQIVAEELYVPLSRVSIVMGDTALTPDEGYTAGSNSVAVGGMSLRWAAAAARQKLLELAASALSVPESSLRIKDGVIYAPDGRKVTYGQLVGGKSFNVTVTSQPPLKPYTQYTIVGQPLPRLTIPHIVYADQPVYVQNLRLPGMLYGRVLRPPAPGAQLLSLDTSVAAKMKGVVQVVRNGSFVGVVARDEWTAIQAVNALRKAAQWKTSQPFPAPEDIPGYLVEADHQDVSELETGSVATALSNAWRRVQAVYTVPYLAHASIGPSAAVALYQNGSYTVWSHTQGVYPLQSAIASLVGVTPDKVHVIHVDGSGCYGHNGADDAAADAALLAQAVPGRPVSVQWMRADEFQWEPYGSAMVLRFEAGVDAFGRVVAWNQDVWGGTFSTRPGAPGWLLPGWYLDNPQFPTSTSYVGTDRNVVPYYSLPADSRVYCHYVKNSPLRVSAHRTLGAFRNVFGIESFVDELSYAVGQDPLTFRLTYLTDPRAITVLQMAARKAGWLNHTKPTGRGVGLAFARYENNGAYVAVVAKVSADKKSGAVRVEKLTSVVDAGQIINPDGLRNQAEGGAIQATSWTLKESVRFNRDQITSVDWMTYPILRFTEVPDVDVVTINRPELPPLGFGEAACVPIGAAIANAVYDAIGVRVRDLPLTPERVKASAQA
jgi:nicotinate dehydrogenase subunit B